MALPRSLSSVLAVCAAGLLLAGCQLFASAPEPATTWAPLPTLPPLATEAPSAPQASPTQPSSAGPSATASPSMQFPLALSSAPVDPTAAAFWARDLAWLHLTSTYPDERLPQDPAWRAAGVQAGIGVTEYLFRADGWRMAVSVPVTAPDKRLFMVQLDGPDGYAWQAEVRPTGASGPLVSAGEPTAPPPTDIAVATDTPALTATPAASATPTAPPAPVVRATRAPASQAVEAWVGTIRRLPAGSLYDDYFEGRDPAGQFGIAALYAPLQAELVAFGESGALVRLWGVVDYGVGDHNGARILVTRIEPAN